MGEVSKLRDQVLLKVEEVVHILLSYGSCFDFRLKSL